MFRSVGARIFEEFIYTPTKCFQFLRREFYFTKESPCETCAKIASGRNKNETMRLKFFFLLHQHNTG